MSSLNGLLDSSGRRIPLALVTEWNRQSLWIRCPYCLLIHHHSTGNPSILCQTRVPHCYRTHYEGLGPNQYQLCYPYEAPAHDYSYEIDKQHHRFVTVGVVLPIQEDDSSSSEMISAEDDDGVEEIEEWASGLSLQDPESAEKQEKTCDEILEELYQDSRLRLDLFFSHCITNNIHGIKDLIKHYDDPFIESRDRTGENCISFAAIEGHTDMVRFLHSIGGNLNNFDNKGRTPLMEAALWGRPGVVDFLLRNGANPNATDRKGRKALFYAQPSRTTTRMRKKYRLAIERSEAEGNRRRIALRLGSYEQIVAREPSRNNGPTESGRFISEQNSQQLQLTYYERATTYNIPDRLKTIARLDRGSLFPNVSAASGWRTDFAPDHIIDNQLWMFTVRELCRLIKYELPEHDCDRFRLPGSFYASHAEKKLIAYYIDKHMILPPAIINELQPHQWGEWTEEHDLLQDLAEVQPKIPTVGATIRVSRAICGDCEKFIKHVEEKLGIHFQVKVV